MCADVLAYEHDNGTKSFFDSDDECVFLDFSVEMIRPSFRLWPQTVLLAPVTTFIILYVDWVWFSNFPKNRLSFWIFSGWKAPSSVVKSGSVASVQSIFFSIREVGLFLRHHTPGPKNSALYHPRTVEAQPICQGKCWAAVPSYRHPVCADRSPSLGAW